MKTVVQIIAEKRFTAAVVIVDDEVVHAAPIVRYMIGRNAAFVKDYCDRKKWETVWEVHK